MCLQIEIEISDTQGHVAVDAAALERLARNVLLAQGHCRGSISIALVDNATIHVINRNYLGHDSPTDVITFPLGDRDGTALAGELVISAEMARNTAREMGVDPNAELALYLVHGLLHLCGFDDHDDAKARRMREREAELLAEAGLRREPEVSTWTA